MNNSALEYLFEETMSIEYTHESGHYRLLTTTFTTDELGEISACGAGIRWEDGTMVVFNDE